MPQTAQRRRHDRAQARRPALLAIGLPRRPSGASTSAKGAVPIGSKVSFSFRGRLAGKALKPGAYRLGGLAKDAAGNASATQRKNFTILR